MVPKHFLTAEWMTPKKNVLQPSHPPQPFFPFSVTLSVTTLCLDTAPYCRRSCRTCCLVSTHSPLHGALPSISVVAPLSRISLLRSRGVQSHPPFLTVKKPTSAYISLTVVVKLKQILWRLCCSNRIGSERSWTRGIGPFLHDWRRILARFIVASVRARATQKTTLLTGVVQQTLPPPGFQFQCANKFIEKLLSGKC